MTTTHHTFRRKDGKRIRMTLKVDHDKIADALVRRALRTGRAVVKSHNGGVSAAITIEDCPVNHPRDVRCVKCQGWDTPKPPHISSHEIPLPSWRGWHYVWYPRVGRASHLMSRHAANNLAGCFGQEGATVHRHPDAPSQARGALVSTLYALAGIGAIVAMCFGLVWAVTTL